MPGELKKEQEMREQDYGNPNSNSSPGAGSDLAFRMVLQRLDSMDAKLDSLLDRYNNLDKRLTIVEQRLAAGERGERMKLIKIATTAGVVTAMAALVTAVLALLHV